MMNSHPIMARLYTLVPMPQGPLAGIGLTERAVLGQIYDRYKLSTYNVTGQGDNTPWYDWYRDEVFCLYAQDDLAAELGISVRTVRRALETLRAAGLIDWRKATYKGACRYYISERVRVWLRPQTAL